MGLTEMKVFFWRQTLSMLITNPVSKKINKIIHCCPDSSLLGRSFLRGRTIDSEFCTTGQIHVGWAEHVNCQVYKHLFTAL